MGTITIKNMSTLSDKAAALIAACIVFLAVCGYIGERRLSR